MADTNLLTYDPPDPVVFQFPRFQVHCSVPYQVQRSPNRLSNHLHIYILLSFHRYYPANFPVAMVPCNSGAGTCAKVQFRSDGSVTGTGFEIVVKLVDAGKVCIAIEVHLSSLSLFKGVFPKWNRNSLNSANPINH